MKIRYPVYGYAYTAWCGRIGQPIADTVIGEVECKTADLAVRAVRRQVRQLTARFPRQVKISKGQFLRMT